MDIEKEIAERKAELDNWLHEIYGDAYGDFNEERDIGYANWNSIEYVLKIAFEDYTLEDLGNSCLDNILFIISRGAEGGRIIAWLSPSVKSLSNIADLKVENFITLCRHALKSGEDYCDYQLASCFQKFENLSSEMTSVLVGLFRKNSIYTKRQALMSLSKHTVQNLESYIQELWRADDDWARLNCLDALKKSDCNKELLHEYKQALMKHHEEYIREYAEKI